MSTLAILAKPGKDTEQVSVREGLVARRQLRRVRSEVAQAKDTQVRIMQRLLTVRVMTEGTRVEEAGGKVCVSSDA